VFVHAGDRARYETLHRQVDELWSNLPDRSGNVSLALRFNQASRWFPPALFWLALGLVGLVLRRPANALALGTPAIAAVVMLVLSALAIAAVPHYAAPMTPGFVLLAGACLFGPRARDGDAAGSAGRPS